MPTISLHTKLQNVLQAAVLAKNYCRGVYDATLIGNVSSNLIVELSQNLRSLIDNCIIPYQKDENLTNYASEQFCDPLFGLNIRMDDGIKLCNNIIAECRSCIPVDKNNKILKDTLNLDGSINVLSLTTMETSKLRIALNTLILAIPD